MPQLAGRDGKLRGRECGGFTAGIDISAGGKRVEGAVFAAEAVEHKVRAVVELKAEPIPTGLCGVEFVSEDFVVHPGESFDGEGLAFERERAFGFDTGE